MSQAAVENNASPQPKASPTPFGLESFLPKPTPVEKPAQEKPAESHKAAPETKEAPKADAKSDASKEEPKASEEAEKVKKQLKDTRDAFTQERQRNKELERGMKTLEQKLEVLGQKFDGTYKEPGPATPEQAAADMYANALIGASYAAAEELFGKEEVDRLIRSDEAPYRQIEQTEPEVKAQVMASKLPVVQAIKILKERELKAKYGSTIEAQREALKKELEPEIEKKVRAELDAKYKGRKAEEPIRGLSGARGVSREEQIKTPVNFKPDSIFKVFPSQPGA